MAGVGVEFSRAAPVAFPRAIATAPATLLFSRHGGWLFVKASCVSAGVSSVVGGMWLLIAIVVVGR